MIVIVVLVVVVVVVAGVVVVVVVKAILVILVVLVVLVVIVITIIVPALAGRLLRLELLCDDRRGALRGNSMVMESMRLVLGGGAGADRDPRSFETATLPKEGPHRTSERSVPASSLGCLGVPERYSSKPTAQ